jgi:hypothetical protein
MVEINGRQVGYLARDATQRLSSAIADAIEVQGTGKCEALVAGRRRQDDFLDVYIYLGIKPRISYGTSASSQSLDELGTDQQG